MKMKSTGPPPLHERVAGQSKKLQQNAISGGSVLTKSLNIQHFATMIPRTVTMPDGLLNGMPHQFDAVRAASATPQEPRTGK
jgi:hypothetical protein